MHITVVGAFDNLTRAEDARRALLHAGVPEARIALDAANCIISVRAQSSLERERIKGLLQRNGARSAMA